MTQHNPAHEASATGSNLLKSYRSRLAVGKLWDILRVASRYLLTPYFQSRYVAQSLTGTH